MLNLLLSRLQVEAVMPSANVRKRKTQMPDIKKLHAVLFRSAKYGRVEELERKLRDLKLTPEQIRMCVNYVDKENACFVTAARNGHTDMVKFLCEILLCSRK